MFYIRFFLIYKLIVKSLKTANESAQIIKKNTVSLHLVCSDDSMQEIIFNNIMYIFISLANFISNYCICADDITFNMYNHILCFINSNNIINYISEVNELF